MAITCLKCHVLWDSFCPVCHKEEAAPAPAKKKEEEMQHNMSSRARYKELGGCCYYCKDEIKYHKITRDHIKPKCEGYGLEKNMVFACKSCNNLKDNLSLLQFISMLQIKVSALIRSAGGEQFGSFNPMVVRYRQMIKSAIELYNEIESQNIE